MRSSETYTEKMAYKINISDKGITIKFEVENESLVGTKIGEKIDGKEIDASLEGYEVEITGTSDKAGFPGFKELAGPGLRKELLTYGLGMHKRPKGLRKKSDKPKGLRLRKTVRGNEVSEDTVQINTKVVKQGSKKFEELAKKPEADAGAAAEVGATEAPKEEAKPEEKMEEKKEEVKAEEKKEEKAVEEKKEQKTPEQ